MQLKYIIGIKGQDNIVREITIIRELTEAVKCSFLLYINFIEFMSGQEIQYLSSRSDENNMFL